MYLLNLKSLDHKTWPNDRHTGMFTRFCAGAKHPRGELTSVSGQTSWSCSHNREKLNSPRCKIKHRDEIFTSG